MKRLTRRSLLQSAAVLSAGVVLRPGGGASGVTLRSSDIGRSQLGTPLTMNQFGSGRLRLFILGGQHGGPEVNTVHLSRMLMDHFAQNPAVIPPNVSVFVLPEGNPDGVANGSRQFVSGVDPNRNWGGADWQSDAYDSNGQYRPGLGGPEPFSEPETAALAGWLWNTWPVYTINYHSVGGFMFGSGEGLTGELSEIYSNASGYPRPTAGGGGGRSPLTYRATGNMNGWMRGVGMGGCLIELASVTDPEFNRNLAGVTAILQRLAIEGQAQA